MCKFYGPKGNEIEEKEFIQFYSNCYYLSCSDVAEREIEEYLKKDGAIRSPMDVMKILEWKLGRIDHKKSQSNGRTYYTHKDMMKCYETRTRSGDIHAKPICDFISQNFDKLTSLSPEEILEKLRIQNIQNLGSVYLITLVSFITKGEYPIFDRFAQVAVSAIISGAKPGAYIEEKALSDRKSNAKAIINRCDSIYVDSLKYVFGERYKQNRDIDRALWVYGHLFESDKKKAKQV